jgi:hypothetical protein
MSAPDSIELLSRIAPLSDAEAAEAFTGRDDLLAAIVRESPPSRRRIRRPLVLVIALVAIAVVTGTAWAMTRGSARETTSVDCLINGVTTVIDASSGDPASDCAAIWPAPVPKLRAYADASGTGVVVIPAREEPRAGWTRIESQDVALIVLQENLGDEINGLDSGCFSSAQAEAFARQQLTRSGLLGWTIDVRPPVQQQNAQPPAGTKAAPGVGGGSDCYGGFADPTSKTVTLFGQGNRAGPANWPPQELANSLRPLTQECLSLAAMQSAVVQRATALGMSQTVENDHNYRLTATKDDTMRCATVYETEGGTTFVVVRGPGSP